MLCFFDRDGIPARAFEFLFADETFAILQSMMSLAGTGPVPVRNSRREAGKNRPRPMGACVCSRTLRPKSITAHSYRNLQTGLEGHEDQSLEGLIVRNPAGHLVYSIPVEWTTLLGLSGRPKYLESEIRYAVEDALEVCPGTGSFSSPHFACG